MPVPFRCHIPYFQNRGLKAIHGGGSLVKGFNDFHAIHIFHNRGVHIGIRSHVLFHHFTSTNQHAIINYIANNAGSESRQSHAPVNQNQI